MTQVPVGRLAPSPTGAQHVGNARTFLLAWLSIRAQGGRLLLRMEDIDSPRIKLGADLQALDDLRWLGLDWDEGPGAGGLGPYYQTQRLADYHAALRELQRLERVYPCTCSRSDVAEAASAPHIGQEGPVYPGTCASRRAAEHHELQSPYCWRFRASEDEFTFEDRLAGRQVCRPRGELGDFVIAKRDGCPAYQLAVVVDDRAMGVTEVVRGDDLLPSTFRQLDLMASLSTVSSGGTWPAPRYLHVPLVIGTDGRRLAKRHGDTRLATMRAQGLASERLVGLLAWSCGWLEVPEPCRPSDLLSRFQWDSIPRRPWVWHDSYWLWLRGERPWSECGG